jgi:hypothetical protein
MLGKLSFAGERNSTRFGSAVRCAEKLCFSVRCLTLYAATPLGVRMILRKAKTTRSSPTPFDVREALVRRRAQQHDLWLRRSMCGKARLFRPLPNPLRGYAARRQAIVF